MKYEYDTDNEVFRRIDGRGRALEFNITEGKRIKTLRELGYSVQKIYDKMDFNNKVTITNLRTFINNLESGNLSVDGDYPAPTLLFEEVDNSSRINELESRIAKLEEVVYAPCECECGKEETGGFKSWLAKLRN